MTLAKIVSGGQTGVDRGALDAALVAGFPCGGWCPADRSAEDGRISPLYPLMPLAHGDYSEGTRQNVLGSDGTAILYRDELWGATLLTRTLCLREGRPYVLIDATRLSEVVAADEVASFVDQNGIDVLNIAGPRSSHWPAGHGFAAGMTMLLIRRLRTFYYTQFGRFSLTF